MADTVVADSKGTAANIVKGITDRSNGTPPVGDVKPGTPAAPVIDPNAGKEKVLVEGKEYWMNPEQMRAMAAKGIAFEPRVSELSRLQSETNAFLNTLRTDPGKILFNSKLGMNPEEVLSKVLQSAQINDNVKQSVGQWYYENVIVPEKMDPKERELAEREKKISSFEAQQKMAESQKMEDENNARIQYTLNQVKAQIGEAMKDSGMPENAQIAKRVADVMRMSYMARKPVNPKEAVAKVKEEILSYQKSYYDSLDEDKLVEQLGKENAEKVRKYFLKLVKQSEKDKNIAPSTPAPRRNERKTITPDDMHEYLDNLKRGGK